MDKLSPLAQMALKTMRSLVRAGHSCVPVSALSAAMDKRTAAADAPIKRALQDLLDAQQLMQATLPNGEAVIYLPAMLRMEQSAAARLKTIASTPAPYRTTKLAAMCQRVSVRSKLTDEQLQAVKGSIMHKVSVLTGGPGTGKTTTLKAALALAQHMFLRVALCAPTGQAAKRMTQATGQEATTIHRLLRYKPQEKTFGYDSNLRLPVDLIVIDEASMLDLWLLQHLLRAVPDSVRLLFVGDIHQLPSVGAGNVLADIIASDLGHVTRLQTIFRQSEESQIVTNARLIKAGQMPNISNCSQDFFMFRVPSEQITAMVSEIVTERIPKHFGYASVDVQVLSPMYKGTAGVDEINRRLQTLLTDSNWSLRWQGRLFKVGDRVIQMRNNYEAEVMNGEVGQISFIDKVAQTVSIQFETNRVVYPNKQLWQIQLAYAITTHRAQGSEYPAVVLPVHDGMATMLQRNLLYTAITRAKHLVVLVGCETALARAIRNVSATQRWTGLADRLRLVS